MDWSVGETVVAVMSIAAVTWSLWSLLYPVLLYRKSARASAKQHRYQFLILPRDRDNGSVDGDEGRVVELDTTDEKSIREFIQTVESTLVGGSRPTR